jgi:glycosyl transferase family 2
MQLSILLPTNRHGPVAISRIAQVCSWATPSIEVIVRDNSGNAEKRALIAHFRGDNRRIESVDPCEPLENYSEILRLATGEFVFWLADDDQCFDHAIGALPGLIDRHGKDPSVAGFTGIYALETSQSTAVINYKDTDSDDAATRVSGFLGYPGPNMLFYSVLRRSLSERMAHFLKTLPIFLSFHDQTLCLLHLLNGKLIRMPRLFYVYDFGIWEDPESGQKRDADYYRAAGLDLAANKLHWLICGFEGAVLAMNSDLFPDLPSAKRQQIADFWFGTMFLRFKRHPRMTFNSDLTDEAEKVCEKIRNATGQLTFEKVLSEMCGFFALFSPDRARAYFDFWNEIINRRQQLFRKTGS